MTQVLVTTVIDIGASIYGMIFPNVVNPSIVSFKVAFEPGNMTTETLLK